MRLFMVVSVMLFLNSFVGTALPEAFLALILCFLSTKMLISTLLRKVRSFYTFYVI